MIHTAERAEGRGFTKDLAAFVNEHHSYIQWADRPARKMYWRLLEDGRMVGVFGLVSAWTFPGAIRRFMAEHELTFNQLANNSVYCLAGHTDRNAGTKLLRAVRRDAPARWRDRYGDELRALQTFIEPPRTGAMYRADNWECLGETSGESCRTETVNAEEGGWTWAGQDRTLVRTRVATTRKLIFARML